MKFAFPTNALVIPIADLDLDDRARFELGDVEELAKSILEDGLIHPPTFTAQTKPGDSRAYRLIAGGRRCTAMIEYLKCDQIPILIREPMDEDEIFALEFVENFHRKEMTWQESVLCIDRTHKAMAKSASKRRESWGYKETGKLLGNSRSHIIYATHVAQYIRNKDEEIMAASSIFDAYSILLRRKEDAAAKEHEARIAQSSKGMSLAIDLTSPAKPKGDFHTLKPSAPVDIFGDKDLATLIDVAVPSSEPKKLELDLHSLFLNGDSMELLPQVATESVDHILTDPPYGIAMENLDCINNLDTMVDTHDVEQNVSMFEPFLENAYRILRPSGYCVFFYDLDHHEKLLSIARKVGFKVQRWPLIWHKLHQCRNNSAQYNFTKNFECAMVLRKGMACLNSPQLSSIIACDGNPDRKLYGNPFAKPQALWSNILSAIARKGETIFDPFCGEMSCARTVINMSMIPMGIEIDSTRYARGISNLTQLLNEINRVK